MLLTFLDAKIERILRKIKKVLKRRKKAKLGRAGKNHSLFLGSTPAGSNRLRDPKQQRDVRVGREARRGRRSHQTEFRGRKTKRKICRFFENLSVN